MKRICSLLLALAMVIGMFPVTAKANELDNGLRYEVYEDHAEITGYTGDATEVVIPTQIEGLPVTAINNQAFRYCYHLTSIVIPFGVISIGDSSFEDCSNLLYISIPDGVTSIGNYAFEDCSSLTSINLPDSVTSIGREAFSNCSSLTNINLPDGVTSIGEHTFNNCSKLTSIVLPNSVTDIGISAFKNCSNLTSVSIPNSVTSIGDSAFSFCSNLINITIPDSVIRIGRDAFQECSSLTSITIPYGITEIAMRTFYGCSSLSLISIPDSVTNIGGGAFYGCSNLTNITIPDDVTDIGSSTFENCYNLTNITIPDGVTYIGGSTFENCTSLTSISIPDSVTLIGDFAFNGCTNLLSISIPNNVTDIGVAAFQDCGSLTSISIPASAIRIDSSAFNDCSSLAVIFVDKNNPNYSSDDRGVFFNKNKSELIRAPGAISDAYIIPNNVTRIGDSAFSFCSNLTSVSIPESVTLIGGFAFLNCTNLSSIRFLGDAPEMDNGVYSIFANITATAYYPAGNATWTADVMQNYGGNITWVAYDPNAPFNPFTDVPAGSWCEAPVLWALENGITDGTSATTFSPGNQCLRAHVVTFLWNAEKMPAPAASSSTFTDVPAGAWYEKPVLWAVEKGITTGVSPTKFGAGDVCTRYQAVFFLWKAAGSPEPKSTNNPFTDVNPGHFFYKAVLWAVENEITSGVSPTEFGPTTPCNRAQVVTFLYKAYN